MATDAPAIRRPVQVFLDMERLLADRQPVRGVSRTDFFEGDDAGFTRHKRAMRGKIGDVASTLRRRRQAADFVHVRMKEMALAKSHRPIGALFTPDNGFSLVGGD